MTTKRPEKSAAPLDEVLIEERIKALRDTSCPCPACQVQTPFHDLDAYRKKIETKIGNQQP